MVMSTVARTKELVLWLESVRLDDIALVGGKNASLGEMIQQLSPQGINVPSGFAITAHAYRHFIQHTGLGDSLQPDCLTQVGKRLETS